MIDYPARQPLTQLKLLFFYNVQELHSFHLQTVQLVTFLCAKRLKLLLKASIYCLEVLVRLQKQNISYQLDTKCKIVYSFETHTSDISQGDISVVFYGSLAKNRKPNLGLTFKKKYYIRATVHTTTW